ncbi:probable aminoacyl tRNA synthase complex-interacting multifunctional protein 2 [Cataglyphis hispanica]|uniref:probable aminoacyl tRNA synthase complex-interacting multifunctional protein 2 n=1 Tax=Cataglyphis hispanica TaxID=1086592 RepID=UPI00217FD054|nr:probable aminoacyl tRNA synthase complex-interacting multifunctional protein 2 [Cataglyphis hispanica]
MSSDLGKVMYPMRPLTTLPPIPPQDVMYRMQNIHEEKFLPIDEHQCRLAETLDTKMPATELDIPEEIIRILKLPIPEYQDLETRQIKVLTQLEDLKKQVCTLSQFLKQSSKAPKSNENNRVETTTDCVSSQEPINIKVVVHADPNYVPYSILALQKVWTDVDIRVISYKHSSIAPMQLMIPFQNINNSAAKTIVHLSLIWKEIKELEVVTGVEGYAIRGESNFLRYLSRQIDAHNYEKIEPKPHFLDVVLDWCYKTYEHLKTGGTYKEVKFYDPTRYFRQRSKTSEYNIAEIALWSLLKRFPTEKMPPEFKPWYKSCEKTFIDEAYTYECKNDTLNK